MNVIHMPASARLQLREFDLTPYMLLLPSAALLLGLVAYPLADAIFLSFTDTNTLSLAGSGIGIANYSAILTSGEFWQAFGTTLIWTALSVTLQTGLGILFAIMLNEKIPFQSLARGMVIFPYLLSTIVAVLIWQWMLNDLYGVVDQLLMRSGITRMPINWLGQMPTALFTVVIVGTWKLFPFIFLTVLARIQSIPDELYHSAQIDGASSWGRFFDITLPQLRSVLVLVVLLRAIWDFKEFDLIYLLTGGGPQIGTQTLPLLIYKEAFKLMHLGRAAAIAVVMLLAILVLLFLYLHELRRAGGRTAQDKGDVSG